MSCIIWMLLKANNVWGNCLEYWRLGSALSGALIACVFICADAFLCDLSVTCECIFLPLSVWWLCVRSHHRCCPGRRAVFSHTPSSIKTTQAARMNWTSSSMEENCFWLFCWTLWVNCTSTQRGICLAHLETHLTAGANWNLNKGEDNDLSVSHAVMSASSVSLFPPHHCERLLLSEPERDVENCSHLSRCFVWNGI